MVQNPQPTHGIVEVLKQTGLLDLLTSNDGFHGLVVDLCFDQEGAYCPNLKDIGCSGDFQELVRNDDFLLSRHSNDE